MIERAPFGHTGHDSTRVIFGAAGLGGVTQAEADAVLDVLLARGVNHLDTAASYGEAELRMGPWMPVHRHRFFLATKTGERTGPEARASLERSLERLQVGQVDLVQLHNLVEEEDWQTAFGPGGAVEALAAARDEGLTRFIGVTGHGLRIPSMHLRSLEAFPFDSVLFPYNAPLLANPGYRADVERLLELSAERGVACQAIKAIARRRWGGDAAPDERRLSWYEPITDDAATAEAVHFVLGVPQLFLITSSDWRRLPATLDAAEQPADAPDAGELLGDEDLGLRALFDGSELERI
ncbi:MAG TPA: aldo/keto reductase [Acidimicrobiales bacterium]|nr:aldo/keto reductase [Acidimicrobiales bacterium]